MKKRLILSAVALLVIALLGGGYGYYHRSQQHKKAQTAALAATTGPLTQQQIDQVFRSYLIKSINSKSLYTTESYSGTGATVTGKSAFDVTKKQDTVYADASCVSQVAGQAVTIKASVQIQGADTYLRLNEVTGTVAVNGKTVYLSDAYAKAVGTWYKSPQTTAGIQTQLDNGVFVFNNGVIAPGHDATKIVDALLTNKAYTYTANRQGSDLVYFFTVNRTNYLGAIKQAFPDLKNPEEAVDLSFDDDATKTSTLVIRQDGTLAKEDTTTANVCKQLVDSFIGAGSDDAPAVLTGTSLPQPDSITIAPVAASKPITEFGKDITL